MRLYFDTAYVAKCYLNEAEARDVRRLASRATGLFSSAWCVPELACVFHRHVRESHLTQAQSSQLRALFLEDVRKGVWSLFPLSERFLFKVDAIIGKLPPSVFLRAGDAIHLAAAREEGFTEIWSNDRHILKAAGGFGLTGKSV